MKLFLTAAFIFASFSQCTFAFDKPILSNGGQKEMSSFKTGDPTEKSTDEKLSTRVENSCHEDVHYLYATDSGTDSWGYDHLGTEILYSGQSLYIDVSAGGCEYDFKAVFRGGRYATGWRVNICNEPYIVINCGNVY